MLFEGLVYLLFKIKALSFHLLGYLKFVLLDLLCDLVFFRVFLKVFFLHQLILFILISNQVSVEFLVQKCRDFSVK